MSYTFSLTSITLRTSAVKYGILCQPRYLGILFILGTRTNEATSLVNLGQLLAIFENGEELPQIHYTSSLSQKRRHRWGLQEARSVNKTRTIGMRLYFGGREHEECVYLMNEVRFGYKFLCTLFNVTRERLYRIYYCLFECHCCVYVYSKCRNQAHEHAQPPCVLLIR